MPCAAAGVLHTPHGHPALPYGVEINHSRHNKGKLKKKEREKEKKNIDATHISLYSMCNISECFDNVNKAFFFTFFKI